MPARAAGRTEWFRGAETALRAARTALEDAGFALHPLRGWVAERLAAQREHLGAGEQAAIARYGPVDGWPLARSGTPWAVLRDALDAYRVLDVPLDDAVSPALRAWHARNSLSPG